MNTVESPEKNIAEERNNYSGSLPANARLTENIYENLMMKDLKTEFQRTQGQISILNDNMSSIQVGINSMKDENK